MMRITLNGEQMNFSVNHRVPKKYWNTRHSKASKGYEGFRELNRYLQDLNFKAFDAFTTLEREEEELSVKSVIDLMNGVGVGSARYILDLWDEQVNDVKSRVGKNIAYATYQRYKTSRKHFTSFLLDTYKSKNLRVSKLKKHHLESYYSYLIREKEVGHNYAIKHLQILKTLVIRAVDNGWLKSNPYLRFPLSKHPVEREFLSMEEIQRISDLNFTIPRLNKVRDLFLFACFTGLAFIDVQTLKRSEIIMTPDGTWWIKTLRQKTKVRSTIPLLELPLSIIHKYCDLGEMLPEEKVFKVSSNQKTNSYLKEIADFAGIHKNLTFHIARHTFATTITLQHGIPIESVSKMLGHTNIKTTQHYAKVLDSKLKEDMAKLKF
jgi:site-specific recombinase XerD